MSSSNLTPVSCVIPMACVAVINSHRHYYSPVLQFQRFGRRRLESQGWCYGLKMCNYASLGLKEEVILQRARPVRRLRGLLMVRVVVVARAAAGAADFVCLFVCVRG